MDGIAWAASAMSAARSRLEIAASNLANVSTDGFRREIARGELTGAGAVVHVSTARDSGALRRTGRLLDLAVAGPGGLTVWGPQGRERVRGGAFVRDAEGAVRDARGRMLLGAAGEPVRIPDGASVSGDGRIRAGGREIGRIALAPGTLVQTGVLESSNVNAVGEMIDVLSAQRAFESAQRVVSAIDATQQKAANDLARVK